MKNLKFISIASVILISSALLSSCTSTFDFENVDTPENSIVIDRGDSFQAIENGDLVITLHGKDVEEESEACVVAGIQNKSNSEIYKFNDSSVSVYEGNIESNEWKQVENWDADRYYKRAKSEAASKEFAQAISGFLNVLDAGTRDYDDNAYYNRNTDVLITSMIENDNMRDLVDENEHKLSFLENNLLYTSDIRENSIYNGVLFFPVNNDYPDYKISFDDHSLQPFNFYFNRSDRAAVLNPWLDQSRARYSFVVEQSAFLNATSLTMHYSRSKGFGYYTGVDLFYANKGLSDLTATDSVKNIGVGYSFGGNIKVASHTWLLTGVDFASYRSYVSNDNDLASNSSYTKKDDYAISGLKYDFGFQVGVNTIFNFIDVSAKMSYFIGQGFCGQVGLGYAF